MFIKLSNLDQYYSQFFTGFRGMGVGHVLCVDTQPMPHSSSKTRRHPGHTTPVKICEPLWYINILYNQIIILLCTVHKPCGGPLGCDSILWQIHQPASFLAKVKFSAQPFFRIDNVDPPFLFTRMDSSASLLVTAET